MPSINSFLKGFQDSLPGMKDFRHASRLYLDDNFKLAPKQKFLFHVVFNTDETLFFDGCFFNSSKQCHSDNFQRKNKIFCLCNLILLSSHAMGWRFYIRILAPTQFKHWLSQKEHCCNITHIFYWNIYVILNCKVGWF